MFKLSAYLSVFIFLFSFIMNSDDDPAVKDKGKKSNLDFIYKATLSNRELSNNKSWFHVFMVTFISFLAIYYIK